MKERVGDEKLIIITNKCNCYGHRALCTCLDEMLSRAS